MSDYDDEVPVLIVGAGPVGLSAAAFLGRYGVRTLLVEKRADTSVLPRAPGLQARTMEIFRAAGMGEEVRALEIGDSHVFFEGGILRVNTYSEIADAEVVEAPSLDGPDISPERVMGCGQDRYEVVLAGKAREFGAEIRFGVRLRTLEQDADGVTAQVEDTATGAVRTVRARYLIGADGAGSTVRRVLGIERSGRGTVFNALSIYFRAPELEAALADRPFILCYATAGGSMTGLSRLHGCDPWLAAPVYHPEKGETPEDFTDERCVEIVRAASGLPEMDVEIMAKVPWEGAQLVAERFRDGRVFLAGDAAHVHPPAGGFGANTGIHDAHNLAWKLAARLGGWAGDALLDTYHEERHAVGGAMAEQAMVRNRIRHGYADDEVRAQMVDDIVITLGYRYGSRAVASAERGPVLTQPLTLTGEPGTRAPHVWLERGGKQISTVDLFWDSFVLLSGPDGGDWHEAAVRIAARTGVPLRAVQIGDGGDYTDVDLDWASAFGVSPRGAVLVRPDAFVAWRTADRLPEPELVLADVLAQMADADVPGPTAGVGAGAVAR
ncbi:FAD-dependent monooxygenase [Spirillospora sp. NPDC048819]|uniref:FAD-dependent monooxygenase n=1 Tax=Spirillospora sp. NPDC048819 TaxID=3155268 RepID=UPI0033DDAC18